MIIDNGEVELATDESEYKSMWALKNISDVEYVVNNESLVIRRSLNVQVSEEVVKQQRENIFYTRCHIKNKICSMIIDNGNCTNIVSTTLVKKLSLTITKHATSYKL
jgi:hypothetical protein